MQKYVKRDSRSVVAVQLRLKTTGFTYYKRGSQQLCMPGDWIVNDDGECYTIDQKTFSKTYQFTARGQYIKEQQVWAMIATETGKIETKEGLIDYEPGDYLVYNEQYGTDGYCVKPDKFTSMYKMEQS